MKIILNIYIMCCFIFAKFFQIISIISSIWNFISYLFSYVTDNELVIK